jgi:hypothetical protein
VNAVHNGVPAVDFLCSKDSSPSLLEYLVPILLENDAVCSDPNRMLADVVLWNFTTRIGIQLEKFSGGDIIVGRLINECGASVLAECPLARFSATNVRLKKLRDYFGTSAVPLIAITGTLKRELGHIHKQLSIATKKAFPNQNDPIHSAVGKVLRQVKSIM